MGNDMVRSIDFVERTDLVGEFLDALDYSRDALGAVIAEDSEALVEHSRFIYPKLRFVLLNAQRYVFASRFLRDGDYVLDAPCGTGYGTAILASNGNNVLGLDIDEATIAMASDILRFPNIEFEVGDIMSYKLPEVDFITCLDGLEHVEDGERLIERFVAALSDTGILVVAVPINELEITGGLQNPYHHQNYDKESLDTLLSRYFEKVTLFGHDKMGTVSGIDYAFDGVTAVCEV